MGGGVAVLEALIPALAQRADWSICVLRPHAVSNAFMAHGVIYVDLALPILRDTAPDALVGMGVGLTFGPSATAAIESAPREQAGIAAGTNSMMRYLGSIVGAGLLAGILSTDGAVPGIGVFRAVFIIVAVIAALAVVAAFWIHRFPPEEAIDVEPRAVPPLSERNVGGLTPSARRIGRSAT